MSTDLALPDPYTERANSAPSIYRTTHERLCVELAMRMEDPAEVFARYRYTPEQAAALMESPSFVKLLERISVEVRETGLSFRMKARALAEETLPFVHAMITDPSCSSAVRADLIKWLPKVGDLEPRTKDEGKGAGGGLTLSITFAGQAPQQVVNTIEQGE